MAKNNRKGKAAIWTKPVIRLLRSQLKSEPQRLIFEISLWTGERIGAIVQLKVSDVFEPSGKVRETITFAGSSRKASKHGAASTRQIYIHDVLRHACKNYRAPASGYLFPSNYSATGHITPKSVDEYWRKILTDHGYSGFSTHSSRRWVINQMRGSGVEIVNIAEAMAINVATVRKYLDEDPAACKSAIATLSI